MDLTKEFQTASEEVKSLAKRPDNNTLLELYALFKQATDGDVTGSRPGVFDLKGRAKFDAWSGKKGLAKDQAMKAYVALVKKLQG